MNYKELLKKYIRYVCECEGTDFIEYGDLANSDVIFTDKQWKELEQIASEIDYGS